MGRHGMEGLREPERLGAQTAIGFLSGTDPLRQARVLADQVLPELVRTGADAHRSPRPTQ
jgi:hypothetical protein